MISGPFISLIVFARSDATRQSRVSRKGLSMWLWIAARLRRLQWRRKMRFHL